MVVLDIQMPKTCVDCPMWEPSVYANCKVLKKRIPYHEGIKGRDSECNMRELRRGISADDLEQLEGCGFEI